MVSVFKELQKSTRGKQGHFDSVNDGHYTWKNLHAGPPDRNIHVHNVNTKIHSIISQSKTNTITWITE